MMNSKQTGGISDLARVLYLPAQHTVQGSLSPSRRSRPHLLMSDGSPLAHSSGLEGESHLRPRLRL